MDRAYEDDKTRALASDHGFIPVVPPKKNRKEPWEYDKKLYKRRNEVERFFLRLKRFRKVCTRYDKLDVVFFSVIMLAMIFDAVFMWTRSRKCKGLHKCSGNRTISETFKIHIIKSI